MSRWAWSAVAAVGALGTATAAAIAFHDRPDEHRGPIMRAVRAAPPVERRVGAVRFVETRESPAILLVDSVSPSRDAQLLWLEGRGAAPTSDGAVVLDAAGGVVEFDRHLRPTQRVIRSEGREWLSVAAAPLGGLWLADATGALFRSDRAGTLHAAPAAGFHYAGIASDPRSAEPWLVRSTRRFAYALDTAPAPLVVGLDTESPSARGVGSGDVAAVARSLGRAVRPEHLLLTDLANAGHLAVGQGVVYYAPFIRDELVAMSFTGETLWVASRALPQSTLEPRFEVANGKVTINYHPVNLGLALGPDGRLYLLSTPGPVTSASRLDVFDPGTGALLRSARFDTALPTLAADAEGRVYALNPFHLLAGVPPRGREPVPAFDLPALDGRRITLAGLRGRVVLVNFWATWCAPCREEMPALDSLRRAITDADFAFLALSDDVSETAAREFLRDGGYTFEVALGRGALRDRFHLPGLPATVLIDREGREVRRWIGYAGPAQLAAIRALVRAELDRASSGGAGHPDAHRDHHIAPVHP